MQAKGNNSVNNVNNFMCMNNDGTQNMSNHPTHGVNYTES